MRTSAVIACMCLGAIVVLPDGWLRFTVGIVFIAAVGRACEPKRH